MPEPDLTLPNFPTQYILPTMTILLLALLFDTACGRAKECSPIYRYERPVGWERLETHPQEIEDTTKPLVAYKKGELLLTIHNFPHLPIPPMAQIERWKRQLPQFEGTITPTSHGGYTGLLLEGGNETQGLIAAAFSLAEPCKHQIRWEEYFSPNDAADKTADCTIKITGPKNLLEQEREALLSLIHSFELIDEI